MLGKDYERQDCAIARALEVIGERWTLLIVRDALYGVRRFSDFHAHLDVPKAVLSDRLSGLVEHGILERRPDPDHAGRWLYELTPAGRELWPVLHALVVWSDRPQLLEQPSVQARCVRHRARRRGGLSGVRDHPPGRRTSSPSRARVEGRHRDDPVAVALRGPHRLLEPLDVE